MKKRMQIDSCNKKTVIILNSVQTHTEGITNIYIDEIKI